MQEQGAVWGGKRSQTVTLFKTFFFQSCLVKPIPDTRKYLGKTPDPDTPDTRK